jgi:integrase
MYTLPRLRLVLPLALLIVLAIACSSGDGSAQNVASTPAPSTQSGSGQTIVIPNAGNGQLEGHTPRGFRGSGTGLFAGEATQYGPILGFMARTGIRRGEAIALHWKNVDLNAATVLIVESAVRVPGQSIIFEATKFNFGRRGIALDQGTVGLMRRHRASQNSHVLTLGGTYIDQGLVFTSQSGGPMDLDDLSHNFKKISRADGHHDVTLHGLRHAHAAGLIKTGAHPKVV